MPLGTDPPLAIEGNAIYFQLQITYNRTDKRLKICINSLTFNKCTVSNYFFYIYKYAKRFTAIVDIIYPHLPGFYCSTSHAVDKSSSFARRDGFSYLYYVLTEAMHHVSDCPDSKHFKT